MATQSKVSAKLADILPDVDVDLSANKAQFSILHKAVLAQTGITVRKQTATEAREYKESGVREWVYGNYLRCLNVRKGIVRLDVMLEEMLRGQGYEVVDWGKLTAVKSPAAPKAAAPVRKATPKAKPKVAAPLPTDVPVVTP